MERTQTQPDERDGPIKPEEEQKASFGDYWRIFQYADGLGWTLNGVAFISAIASGSALPLMTIVFGQFTSKFTDYAGGTTDPGEFQGIINEFVLWFIYLFVGKFVLAYVATMSITISGTRTTRALRKAYFDRLLRTEIWYFDMAKNTSPAVQISTNAARINQGISEKFVLMVQGLAMLFSAFIVAIVIQWKLALITLTSLPAMFIVIGICLGIDASIESNVVKAYSNGAALAQEVLSSIKTVHAFSAQDGMVTRYGEYLEEAHRYGNKKTIPYGVMSGAIYFCLYAGNALAFWQGYRMFQSGEIESVGEVFTVVLCVVIASTSLNTFFPQLSAISNAVAAAGEFFQMIDKLSQLDPLSNDGEKPRECQGVIEVRNLTFAYPSRPTAQVLNNFTISVPAGKTTALVGASGSGKSTLIGLLERWYEPTSGDITVDGLDIRQLNTKWLRSQMALVQQEPVLFRGTVFQNVAKGFSDSQKILPYEEQLKLVEDACKSSYSHEFIENLPQGYFTYLGERGSMLSGGQKQRVAIARSIVANPKILLLDEATSALDPQAERVVQEALDSVSRNRTTIIIAHRLSTVKNADNIAVISKGEIVEQGTHEELISLGGNYAALVKAQDIRSGSAPAVEENEEVLLDKENAGNATHRHLTHTSTRGADEESKPEPGATTRERSLWKILFLILQEQKNIYPLLGVVFIASIIAAATWPAQALLFSELINIFAPGEDQGPNKANFFALMFFIVALGNLLAYTIIGGICNLISQKITHCYRLELFQRMVNMDIEFFDRPDNTSGALASNLLTVPNNLQELISINIFVLLIILISLVASCCLALAYGWKLALVMIFAGLPVLIGASLVQLRLEAKMNNNNEARFSKSASLAVEAVSALRTVSSLTLETDLLEEYSQSLAGILRRSAKSMILSMALYALSQSADFLVMALGFWYGSRLMASGEYTTHQFFIIFMSVLFAGQGAAQFFAGAGSITRATSAGTFLLGLRDERPQIQETDKNKDRGPKGDGNLTLNQVKFSYPSRPPPAIRGVSMRMSVGQFVAFVGHSGCGKSTLISLLERYYDPTSGTIDLDDENIANLSPQLYREQMSLVQQEPILFHGTVKENICLGAPSQGNEVPTEDAIHEAAKQANAFDFIISLPQGFNTPCGAQGTSFSGGQRQRIALARALIRNPKLLLLDEATSALDTQSERIIQAALDEAGKSNGRTTIAVAHRLSTIRGADMIFVLSDGKVIEKGTHEELQGLGGVYYQMCLAQSLDRSVGIDEGE